MEWKEAARDVLALGSIPFYAIVIVRMLLLEELAILVPQLVIAFFGVLILSRFIEIEYHIAQGLILIVFTSLGYKEAPFTVFAGLLWILMLYSAYYLKIKKNKIINGAVVGIISTIVAYYAALILF